MRDFKGVYAALLTPFDAGDNVDETLLREHVRFLLDAGIDGLYVCGNSGQGLYMDVEERKRVLELALEENAGRAAVIAHVAALATRDAQALAQHANTAGADAIASLPPVYWSYTPDEIVGYYRDLNRANELPCFIYHIPAVTGQELDMDTLLRLAEIPQLAGLKYTSSDFFRLQSLLQRLEGKWIAFSGPDELFLPALTMGVAGSIGSMQNVFPELFRSIYEDFHAGNTARAATTQAVITRVFSTVFEYGRLGVLKALLKLRGLDPGRLRPPMTAGLTPAAEEELLARVRACVAPCPQLALTEA